IAQAPRVDPADEGAGCRVLNGRRRELVEASERSDVVVQPEDLRSKPVAFGVVANDDEVLDLERSTLRVGPDETSGQEPRAGAVFVNHRTRQANVWSHLRERLDVLDAALVVERGETHLAVIEGGVARTQRTTDAVPVAGVVHGTERGHPLPGCMRLRVASIE